LAFSALFGIFRTPAVADRTAESHLWLEFTGQKLIPAFLTEFENCGFGGSRQRTGIGLTSNRSSSEGGGKIFYTVV
jgi:hypothetical protein